jgi:hypothetical protein
MRMIDERVPKKVMKRDAKKMFKCRNWRRLADRDTSQWRIEEA